jgi:LPXTG-motif cell wall-anchored protein
VPPKTPPGQHPHGSLPHTGADVEIALGVAGAALLAGFGLRAAARRREED